MQSDLIRSSTPINGHWRPGRLHVICGCMFAGKTEALIDQVRSAAGVPTQVFKHRADDRYHATRVVSHRGRSWPALPVGDSVELLDSVADDVASIAVDEGHFFDAGFPAVCLRLTRRGVHVLVAALDRDSVGRQPFAMIARLCDSADEITAKSAMCARCGARALYTQRLTTIVDDRLVGGAESFEPRCARCWTPPANRYDQITRLASKTGPCVQHSS